MLCTITQNDWSVFWRKLVIPHCFSSIQTYIFFWSRYISWVAMCRGIRQEVMKPLQHNGVHFSNMAAEVNTSLMHFIVSLYFRGKVFHLVLVTFSCEYIEIPQYSCESYFILFFQKIKLVYRMKYFSIELVSTLEMVTWGHIVKHLCSWIGLLTKELCGSKIQKGSPHFILGCTNLFIIVLFVLRTSCVSWYWLLFSWWIHLWTWELEIVICASINT